MTRSERPVVGVAYYPEQDPESEWITDLRLMRDAGIQVIRVGEFAWNKMQKRNGNFTLEWMERLLAIAGEHGIQCILCTPTAAPPVWICERFPDLPPRLADGREGLFGGRRHYSVFHEGYRQCCVELATALGERFGSHPSVLGWQIDNEVGSYGLIDCSPSAARAWGQWLELRYGSVDHLNTAWNLVFWNQEVERFNQVPEPTHMMTTRNPSLVLEYNRFMLEGMADFLLAQAKVISPLSPGREVIPSCTEEVLAAIHCRQCGERSSWITGAAIHNYPELTPSEGRVSMRMDLFRHLGRDGRFLVLEQQSGSGFTTTNSLNPAVRRFWVMEALSRGARMIVFFHWRRFRGGCEWKHPCVLERDRRPRSAYKSIAEIAGQVRKALDLLDGGRVESGAQILIHWDSLLARDRASELSFWMEIQLPDAKRHRFPMWESETLRAVWLPLSRMGVSVDFVGEGEEWDVGKPLFVTDLPLCDEMLRDRLTRFCEAGGRLVCFPGAAHRDRWGCHLDTPPPGILTELFGASLSDYLPLRSGKGRIYDAATGGLTDTGEHPSQKPRVEVRLRDGQKLFCDSTHAEVLDIHAAEELGVYETGIGPAQSAFSMRHMGSGTAIYLGAPPFCPEDALTLYRAILPGLPSDQTGPASIRWTTPHGRFEWLMNSSDHPLELSAPVTDVLTGQRVAILQPMDAVLVRT